MDAESFAEDLKAYRGCEQALDAVWQLHEKHRAARLAAQEAESALLLDHDVVRECSTKAQ
jgi:hypothetical protein